MSHPSSPQSLSDLQHFNFIQILNHDPIAKAIVLLGTLPSKNSSSERVQAIIKFEKSAFPTEKDAELVLNWLKSVDLEESTDIYTWFFGHFHEDKERRDVKINVICPATEVHIRKYTTQRVSIVRETPELFHGIVEPYILSIPKARTQWVMNILSGASEADKILFNSSEFVLLPDMKWDLTTLTSLYLTAIVRDESIRCLRDLTSQHLGLLQNIRTESYRVVQKRWGLGEGSLRLFIHYQPSYYHFHVHVVNANAPEAGGMAVGQAHLLDDIISLLELDGMILGKMTLTYGLGERHALFDSLISAQSRIA